MSDMPSGVGGEQTMNRCSCGGQVLPHGVGANWGDLRCVKCGKAYCQDCGSPLFMDTMTCPSSEEWSEAALAQSKDTP